MGAGINEEMNIGTRGVGAAGNYWKISRISGPCAVVIGKS